MLWDEDECPETANAKTKAIWKPNKRLLLTGDGIVFESLWLGHGPTQQPGGIPGASAPLLRVRLVPLNFAVRSQAL